MGRRPRHPLPIEFASVPFGSAEHCPGIVGYGRRCHRTAAAGMEEIDANKLDSQQERRLQGGPQQRKPAQASQTVTGVEVDVQCAQSWFRCWR